MMPYSKVSRTNGFTVLRACSHFGWYDKWTNVSWARMYNWAIGPKVHLGHENFGQGYLGHRHFGQNDIWTRMKCAQMSLAQITMARMSFVPFQT